MCPVTTANNGFPLHVKLPDSLDERYGYVVTEQVRAYNLEARRPEVVAHLDADSEFTTNIASLERGFF